MEREALAIGSAAANRPPATTAVGPKAEVCHGDPGIPSRHSPQSPVSVRYSAAGHVLHIENLTSDFLSIVNLSLIM